jgi:hypothetical protein
LRPLAGYSLAAIVFTWPLALHPFRLLASVQGPGDAYLNLWIIGWDLGTLTTHPAAILTGQVFNANIFHPTAGTLAFSDHFLLQSIGVSPLYLVTHNLAFCYNAVFAGSLIAAAWAMHGAVRAIVASEPAAWAAGIAWGFAPYHFGHLIHIQLQALYFLPLAFLFLHRVISSGRARDAGVLGVMVAAEAIASVYYGVMGAVALAVGAIGLLTSGTGRSALGTGNPAGGIRRWSRLAFLFLLAAIVAAILVAPIAWQYFKVQRNEGFGRSLAEASQGSARAGAYLTAPPGNLVYGRTGVLTPTADDPSHKATEQMLFPGFTLMVLATVGLWHGRKRNDRPLVVALALIGATGFVFSLGPDGVRPLYALAHRVVFGFQAIRAPARFAVLVLFALAGLAAIGVRELARARPRLALAAVALVAIEFLNAPLPYVDAPQLDTRAGRWLRDAPEAGAVMYQPIAVDAVTTTPFMVQSLIHGRPIVNGYSGLRPAFYSGLAQTMTQFPSLETVKALDDLDVRFVVTPAPLAVADLPLVERARFDDSVIYEIKWTPETVAAMAANDARPRPLPTLAPLPFSIGETAVYSIVWTTGPLSLPAGHATFRVAEGKNGAHLQLSVVATTASWVSRFFEADDRFESTVDAALRPSVFEQHLHEGSRKVDRRVTFDRAARTMRLQQGDAAAISLPVSPDTLDPVSAFYYLRALPVADGPAIRLPVTDWGRDLTVTVAPGVVETITAGGAQRETLRIEPRVSKPDDQSAGYRLTVWISRDARRIPLAMTVDRLAGVGSVRLELESYVAGGAK